MLFGHRYPLFDPTRFDDELGTGYNHAEPARQCDENHYCVDCWIVDRNGNRHPGYSRSPVPVRSTHMNQQAGFLIGASHAAIASTLSTQFIFRFAISPLLTGVDIDVVLNFALSVFTTLFNSPILRVACAILIVGLIASLVRM